MTTTSLARSRAHFGQWLCLFAGLVVAISFSFAPNDAFAERSVQGKTYSDAVKAFNSGDLQTALTILNNVVAVDPANRSAHYYRALCYHKLNQLNMAAKCYEYLTTNFPGSEESIHSAKALAALKQSSKTSAGGTATNVDMQSWPAKARIPFFRDHSGHYIVRAQIDGHGPFDMFFDTGAHSNYVGLDQLAVHGVTSIQLSGEPEGLSGGVGASGPIPFWTKYADLRLGDSLFRNVPFAVVRNNPADPLIGEELLKYYSCEIDSGIHTILMTRKDSYQTTHEQRLTSVSVPFRRIMNQMVVDLNINGKTYPFFFDTGAFGMALSRVAVRKLGIPLGESCGETIISGVGGKSHATVYRIDSISLGPIAHRGLEVVVDEDTQSDIALIGQAFWTHTGWQYTIDNTRSSIDFYRR